MCLSLPGYEMQKAPPPKSPPNTGQTRVSIHWCATCINFTGPTPIINYGACQGEDHWRTLASNKGAFLSEAWPATLFHDSARARTISNLNATPLLLSCTSLYKSCIHLELVYWNVSASSRIHQSWIAMCKLMAVSTILHRH